MLLDAAKELVGLEFLFTRWRAAQQANVQNDNVTAPRLHAIEYISEVIHVEVIADRHKNVAGPSTDRFGRQFPFQLEIELVHLHVGDAFVPRALLGDGEDDIENHGKNATGNSGYRLGEQVGNGDDEKGERDEAQAERNLLFADSEIQRYLEFAFARVGVTENEHRQTVHRKTPDHAEGIEVRKKGHIPVANNDGEELQGYDDVDDAAARAEAGVRLAEPVAQHAIFRDAVEYTIRAHDCRVHGPRQDDGTHYHDEDVEDQPQQKRAFEAHGQAADEVFQEALPDDVWNDHHREERNQRREDHAVNENDQPGLFQVDQLRAFDFAIDLRERLFAAHCQHGVAERDKDCDDAEHVWQRAVRQPPQCAFGEMQIVRIRERRQGRTANG